MNDTNHLPPDDVLRRIGAALQQEYRLAGIELPPNLTPEQLARSVFDGLRGVLEDEAPAYVRIHAEVKAELGPMRLKLTGPAFRGDVRLWSN